MIEGSTCLAIVWHSRTGLAQAMAAAIAEGAGDTACLIAAGDADPGLLAHADGFVFACPENLGTMSGAMKEMFDRCYYPLLGRIEGRPYATAIAAGSSGTGAEAQIDRIVTGWRLRRVTPSLIVNLGLPGEVEILAPKTLADADRQLCRELGLAMGEGLRAGIF